MGTLFIVATPIGNLKDITIRAIDILKSVDFIACEDTRRTGILLQSLSIQTKSLYREIDSTLKAPTLISYYEQNEFERIPKILNLLKNNCNVALVSDAGTPTISDPGFKLVRECVNQGIIVESIPGASSVIASLVCSGLPTDKFLFVGYLPRKGGNKKKLLAQLQISLESIKSTVILFEAPHRLVDTLIDIQDVFGNISMVICRELTKIHEDIKRDSINTLIAHFEKTKPKGEFVMLFNLSVQ